MQSPLTLKSLYGEEIRPQLPAIAQLRIAVFREYPYLYDGDPEYERSYLQAYVRSPRSMAVAVFDGGNMVGVSTCCPLADEDAAFRAPFERAGFDVGAVFYFGESVLLPAYRGRGLYRSFFQLREEQARRFPDYRYATFCAVQRPEDHPRRPQPYKPHDAFWSRVGYRKRPDLHTLFSWKDLDEEDESPKPLVFWLKNLA